jgi:hypothetical protein
MRRTKVTQIYKKRGNLRAVQLLLGHTKMDGTVRYLGVELEDALAIAEASEIQGIGPSSRTAQTGQRSFPGVRNLSTAAAEFVRSWISSICDRSFNQTLLRNPDHVPCTVGPSSRARVRASNLKATISASPSTDRRRPLRSGAPAKARKASGRQSPVERQPPCPRATDGMTGL